MTDKSKESFRYEEAFAQLEAIVKQLDEGNLSLDELDEKFEEGMRLSEYCSKRLEQVEKKVQLLIEKSDGSLDRQPFEEESL